MIRCSFILLELILYAPVCSETDLWAISQTIRSNGHEKKGTVHSEKNINLPWKRIESVIFSKHQKSLNCECFSFYFLFCRSQLVKIECYISVMLLRIYTRKHILSNHTTIGFRFQFRTSRTIFIVNINFNFW